MLSFPQVMIRVWRFCWSKRFFTRQKAILSALSTVLCKILSCLLFQSMYQRVQSPIDYTLELPPPPFICFSCRIRDNEGAAEMLIDTLGPVIVNAKDSKNRYVKLESSSGNFISLNKHILFWDPSNFKF